MKPETKRRKELDEQERLKIIHEAKHISYDFERWGFEIKTLPLHPHNGWAKMTPEQVYNPEIYALYLNDECIANDLYIVDLRKIHIKAKRYRHDHGVRKLRENIRDVINDK